MKFLVLFLLSLQSQAQNLLNVDLQEVVERDRKAPAWAQQVLHHIRGQEPDEFARARIRLSEINTQSARGHIFVPKASQGYFQKFEVDFQSSRREVARVRLLETIPISKTQFRARAVIKQLVTVLQDEGNDLTIYYPFGASGIDHNVTPRSKKGSVFMTPFFNGSLPKNQVISRRCQPSYYKCKPFLRMIPSGTDHSLYGYHAEPYQDLLERGFVSAGCFRLQDSDLFEFHDLIRFGGNSAVPFEMVIEDKSLENVHPYPKVLDSYEGVTRWRLKEGRIVFNTGRVRRPPPLDEVRFMSLQEVKRVDEETRRSLYQQNSSFFTKPLN